MAHLVAGAAGLALANPGDVGVAKEARGLLAGCLDSGRSEPLRGVTERACVEAVRVVKTVLGAEAGEELRAAAALKFPSSEGLGAAVVV